ncbi:MAG: hypothetical protein AB8B67_04170 [Rickettsiaceae bacterium]
MKNNEIHSVNSSYALKNTGSELYRESIIIENASYDPEERIISLPRYGLYRVISGEAILDKEVSSIKIQILDILIDKPIKAQVLSINNTDIKHKQVIELIEIQDVNNQVNEESKVIQASLKEDQDITEIVLNKFYGTLEYPNLSNVNKNSIIYHILSNQKQLLLEINSEDIVLNKLGLTTQFYGTIVNDENSEPKLIKTSFGIIRTMQPISIDEGQVIKVAIKNTDDSLSISKIFQDLLINLLSTIGPSKQLLQSGSKIHDLKDAVMRYVLLSNDASHNVEKNSEDLYSKIQDFVKLMSIARHKDVQSSLKSLSKEFELVTANLPVHHERQDGWFPLNIPVQIKAEEESVKQEKIWLSKSNNITHFVIDLKKITDPMQIHGIVTRNKHDVSFDLTIRYLTIDPTLVVLCRSIHTNTKFPGELTFQRVSKLPTLKELKIK